MDNSDFWFSEEAAQAFYRAGVTFLTTYMSLSSRAAAADVAMWNITPKFHNVAHVFYSVMTDRVNPKFYHCYADEDFVGRIGRIGARVHPRTMSRRTIERYLMGLHHRFAKAGDNGV
jgi:hypothetical protein